MTIHHSHHKGHLENKKDHHNHCNHASQEACIFSVPIFNHLEPEQMQEIMGVIKDRFYEKGEILYGDGDPSDSLYIVRSGKIRIYRLSESGKEQLVRILTPGDFTGELALFRKSIHTSFAEAMVKTEVCMITRSDLQEFLLKYPSISLRILAEFSNRLDEAETQTTRFATEKVEARIAFFLAECIEEQESSEITLPMAKKDLASYLGTTPETISRKLAELEDSGYIRQNSGRKIEILDLEGLLLV
ncbi:MAG: Crp/Fnr family transcriptional regulator [Anaerovoracaceae bacterium]|jgi:CRP-like cAMP-binding protein